MKRATNATGILTVILVSLCLVFLFAACGKEGSPTQAAQPSSDSAEKTDMPGNSPASQPDTASAIVLSGPGNSPANLLHEGMSAEYDGYIYHTDKMMEGNIWRTPVAAGESELLCKGSFRGLNVNGGVIFALVSSPDPASGLEAGGICRMNTDGSNAKLLKEGYFSRLILNDEYLYYTDGSDGSMYRMKYDASEEKLLLKQGVFDSFIIVNGALYLYCDLDEEYVTNIYKMPLDGSAAPKKIIDDIFGGVSVGLNEIFYSARDNSSNMFRYDTATGEKSGFTDRWIDYVNTDGEYLYYFWSGAKADNSDSGLYRMKPDTSENQMLLPAEELYDLNISGKKLFWHNNDEMRRLTTAKLDCTDVGFVVQAPE